jgi:hypothetical protein
MAMSMGILPMPLAQTEARRSLMIWKVMCKTVADQEDYGTLCHEILRSGFFVFKFYNSCGMSHFLHLIILCRCITDFVYLLQVDRLLIAFWWSQVSRLVYSNIDGETNLLALTSSGMHKRWDWKNQVTTKPENHSNATQLAI